MVDDCTNLYTLTSEFVLAERATGPEGRVLTTPEWHRDFERIRQEDDKRRALASMRRLATLPLAQARTLAWFKYPMHFTEGAMEVRADGVRCYGEPIGRLGSANLLVFEAAERKQHEDEADKTLLARTHAVCETIGKRWRAVEAAQAKNQASNAKVVNLDAARQRNKRKR